jgi:hypothetical protein
MACSGTALLFYFLLLRCCPNRCSSFCEIALRNIPEDNHLQSVRIMTVTRRGERRQNVVHSRSNAIVHQVAASVQDSTAIPRYTSNRFTSFRLYEMHKLIPIFQFTIQFSLARAPSSRKPIVVPGASSPKLIFVLRVFDLRAVWRN